MTTIKDGTTSASGGRRQGHGAAPAVRQGHGAAPAVRRPDRRATSAPVTGRRATTAVRAGGELLALAATAASTVPLTLVLANAARDAVAALAALPAHGPQDLPDAVAAGLLAVGAACAAWYACTAFLGLVVALLPRSGAGARLRSGLALVVGRAGAPVVRRIAAGSAVAGLSLGLAVGPAAAVPDAPESPTDAPSAPASDDEAGTGGEAGPGDEAGPRDDAGPPVPGPDLPAVPAVPDVTGSSASPLVDSPAPAPGPEPAPAPEPELAPTASPEPAPEPATAEAVYVVAAGDSLWSIAADHLGPSASTADVAAAWPDWYSTNAEVIGADPDLVRAGVELTPPTLEETR
ncbi:LysM peptidoglycan-binding domain-containing protein [Georgenia sp. Z1491]|uniref:LysM peptidoglycan-binding domain-containing protein n=1 Tax=Georgenia sp. Z1491 TaxID=3416707 RepID=UPI003CE862A6